MEERLEADRMDADVGGVDADDLIRCDRYGDHGDEEPDLPARHAGGGVAGAAGAASGVSGKDPEEAGTIVTGGEAFARPRLIA